VAQNKGIKCPVCGEHLEVEEDELSVGDLSYCIDCDEELKVVNVEPLKLKRMVEILEVYNEDRQNGFVDEEDLEQAQKLLHQEDAY